MSTLPRCHADIKTPERTTSVVDIPPCNAVMSPFQRENQVSVERVQMMERLPVNQGKLLPWLNCLPRKSVRRRAQTPQLRWCSLTNCRTPPTPPLSLQKGEQLKKNLPDETPISYKSSCTSRKLKTSKFCLCPGHFVRGTSRCISKYCKSVDQGDPI